MVNPLDKYDLGARLYPALLVLFPVELVCFAWVSKWEDLVKPLIGAGVSAGLSVLLATLARYYGKKLEPKLIVQWGGLPSTIMLRHADSHLDVETKKRYYEILGRLVPGVHIPTEIEEQADPRHADDVYQTCCRWLLEQTREQKRFPLLFKENVSYGYHRNLLGLRPLGIVVSVIGMIGCFWKLLSDYHAGLPVSPLSVLCSVAALALVFMWLIVINSNFVRQAGDAYALRLVASCDVLGASKSVSEPKAKQKDRKKD